MNKIQVKIFRNQCIAVLLISGLTVAIGCNQDVPMYKVTGMVTVDGDPLEKGSISFEPADAQGITAGTSIKSGKYEAEVPAGMKKVRITGFDVVGKVAAYEGLPDGPQRDQVEDLVPSQYNTNTELTLQVKAPSVVGDFGLSSEEKYPEPEPDTDAGEESDADTEATSEPAADADSGEPSTADTETEAETESEPETEPETESDTDASEE